ncbi:MAG: hypothetical protein AAGG01_07645 [Planctomycetota bacterium]
MHAPISLLQLLALMLTPLLASLPPLVLVAALFAGASCTDSSGAEPSSAETSSAGTSTGGSSSTDISPTSNAQEPPLDPLKGWGTYRVGEGEFRYPPGWRVQASAYGLSLIPSDHRPDSELISITAAPAPGVTSATSSSIAQALDGLMQANMPGMRRSSPPRPFEASPSGGETRDQNRSQARYDWKGVAPDGRRAEAAAWVVVEAGQSAGVSIVADPATLRSREKLLARVAGSMRSSSAGSARKPGEPAIDQAESPASSSSLDPRLIGMFTGESIHSSSGVYVNTQLVTALGADGVVHYGARSHINASQKASDGSFRWTASGSSDGSVQKGRWQSSGNLLTIRWQTGSVSTFRYGFEPDGTLALRNPANGKLINIYTRVR